MLLGVIHQFLQRVEGAVAGHKQCAGGLIRHRDEHAADGELVQRMGVLTAGDGGAKAGVVHQQVQAVGICVADGLGRHAAAAGHIVDNNVVAAVNLAHALNEHAAGHVGAAASLGGDIHAHRVAGPVALAGGSGGLGLGRCLALSGGAGGAGAAGGQAERHGGSGHGCKQLFHDNVPFFVEPCVEVGSFFLRSKFRCGLRSRPFRSPYLIDIYSLPYRQRVHNSQNP